nr:immunoglobulin light chain junction region [Macaca mulatta]
CQQYDRAPWTF